MILRISRTYPRVHQQGIGLHCYFFSKSINVKTVIFTKKIDDKFYDVPKNVTINEINYSDIKFPDFDVNFKSLLIILITKFYGEIIFFINIFIYLLKNSKKVKIIHLHSSNYIFTAFFIKLIFKKKIVINFGGTDLKRIRKYTFLQYIVKNFDSILYVSSDMRTFLDSTFTDINKYHIGNGVDLENFKVCYNEPKKNNLLAIGNPRWQKGYKILFDSINLLKKEIKDVKLYIAGSSDEILLYKDIVVKMNLENTIIFLGSISRIELSRYLLQTKVYVSSSVSEGFPKALIEAICSGVPCVVTDVGQCSSIVKNKFGYVVPSNNHIYLYKSIKNLLQNNSLRLKYKSNCIKSRENFSWNKVIKIVERCYQDLNV